MFFIMLATIKYVVSRFPPSQQPVHPQRVPEEFLVNVQVVGDLVRQIVTMLEGIQYSWKGDNFVVCPLPALLFIFLCEQVGLVEDITGPSGGVSEFFSEYAHFLF